MQLKQLNLIMCFYKVFFQVAVIVIFIYWKVQSQEINFLSLWDKILHNFILPELERRHFHPTPGPNSEKKGFLQILSTAHPS